MDTNLVTDNVVGKSGNPDDRVEAKSRGPYFRVD
ncbi:hypothetical protein MKAN_07755 [Mycobacterium kansasii ATCC 12478]|uniref:Uncharacterized protein n=1 Tax=Mycobacterium kansasii ATCC 12478 TaxID=557599 RepID=U5X1B1_MYCKA|nr:hypothetical protein MKAN_07755 [Mycobacterium kansasii ATCC 12478]